MYTIKDAWTARKSSVPALTLHLPRLGAPRSCDSASPTSLFPREIGLPAASLSGRTASSGHIMDKDPSDEKSFMEIHSRSISDTAIAGSLSCGTGCVSLYGRGTLAFKARVGLTRRPPWAKPFSLRYIAGGVSASGCCAVCTRSCILQCSVVYASRLVGTRPISGTNEQPLQSS